MRGLYSSKTKIRHEIFTEIARMAYEDGDCRQMEQLPYKIVPGEVASYREIIFLERAVVGRDFVWHLVFPLERFPSIP